MTIDAVSEMTNNALYVIIKVSLPVLLVSLIVGLIISIFQTVTSIQEQTLTFVPKIIAIFLTLILLGSWMIDFSFSIYDLEYFLLIFVRVSCFVYIAPYFGMNDTPARIRIGISFFTSILLYETLTPADAVVFDTVMEYAVIVMKEAIAGLLIGFGANICMAIVNFAGSIADMETGLSMATLMDPATRESTSITGALYQYSFMLMLIASGMYRYLFGALADSFTLIPINGVTFHADSLLNSMIEFMNDYILIGFRIVLPIFCVTLLLNAILGVLAKVSPQMNMFAVGIQLKVLAGLSALFLTAGMLPGAADFVYQEMKKMVVSFIGGMM